MEKPVYRLYRATTLFLISLLFLMGVAGCTRYNPYTGTYEVDKKGTMMAVGAAAFTGSVIYHEKNRDYHRPPSHHHYNHPPPPPGHHR